MKNAMTAMIAHMYRSPGVIPTPCGLPQLW
jgi:hypothetical protein